MLEELLSEYPDIPAKEYLITGFLHGFDTGLAYSPQKSLTCSNNLSCQNNMETAKDLMEYELSKGYVIGPFKKSPFQSYRINPISIAEGKYSGKKRLVVDLSAPHDSDNEHSLNDLIDKDDFSLTYVRLDQAIRIIRDFGQGTILMKTDIKDAFKLIPVQPSLWHLYGVQLHDNMYFFTKLVFGSRSSPKIFDTFASAVNWIIEHVFCISPTLHLLDDYLTLLPPDSNTQHVFSVFLSVFNSLGIPLSEHKTVGPTCQLEYLGIILDTNLMQARLPMDKLLRIRGMLTRFLTLPKCTKRELLSLLGHLNFASTVIVPGRSFISRLIQASKSVKKLHFYIYLNRETKLDIIMWQQLLEHWNGISMFIDPHDTIAPDMDLYTDASRLGYAGFYQGKWFSAEWPNNLNLVTNTDVSMTFCELYPIVVASIVWGSEWSGKRIVFHCDNMGTVQELLPACCRLWLEC